MLDPFIIFPAVSQGAIAIEIRNDDHVMDTMVKAINHEPTFTAVTAERTFLRTLEGGCQVPIGCFSQIYHGSFKITGFVSNLDGSGMIKDSLEDGIGNAEKTAMNLAQHFLERGAGEMIRKIRIINNL
jgi:hydroxymethylbilane synthase